MEESGDNEGAKEGLMACCWELNGSCVMEEAEKFLEL